MENQTISSYIGFILLIIMYALLLYVWSNVKHKLTYFMRYLIFLGVIYTGTLKSIDFANGVNLFDRYLLVHLFLAGLIYFILIGFKMYEDLTYTWRIKKLKNIFKWHRCKLSFTLMKEIVKEKKREQEESTI